MMGEVRAQTGQKTAMATDARPLNRSAGNQFQAGDLFQRSGVYTIRIKD